MTNSYREHREYVSYFAIVGYCAEFVFMCFLLHMNRLLTLLWKDTNLLYLGQLCQMIMLEGTNNALRALIGDRMPTQMQICHFTAKFGRHKHNVAN